MPKPAHTRVVFEGVIGSVAAPIEHWAFGVNFPVDVLPADGTQTVDDAVAASLKDAYSANINPLMPPDTILTGVKVSRVGADGHVEHRADGSYVQGGWIGSVVGTMAGSPDYPLQTALCVSLTTLRPGSTGKGRFFLPFPGYTLADDKRLTSVNTNAVATMTKDFLNALATVTTFPPQVVSSKGYMTEVTGLRVGRAPDTMRSRREDLVEGYIDLPLA